MLSTIIHCGYPTKKKNSVRITVTERYNPLQKIPFLRDENAPLKMPYTNDDPKPGDFVDYNKIVD